MRRRPAKPSEINDLFADQPSLFDDPVADLLPVHPVVKAHVVRVKMEGGSGRPQREAAAQPAGSVVDSIEVGKRQRPLRFISFGSGSSGNCSYIGDGDHGVLIDAGVDVRHVERTLLANAITFESISGICLTHDHSDHVCNAYHLLREHKHLRLYCTPKTLNGLLRRHNISRRIKDYHVPIYKEFPFSVGPVEITAFDVSHDGTDNCGYFVSCAGRNFAIATDLGCITERVDHYMRLADYLVIEANYDATMLRNGPYPQYLQARIMAGRGHLDNVVTGQFLASIVSDRLKGVFLCHLSHDNNTPEIALDTVRRALAGAGITAIGDASSSFEAERCQLQLAALPRYAASPFYTLR